MNEQRFLFTRRDFLKGAVIAGLGATIPQFLTESAYAQNATTTSNGERILVVIQMGGGNDGINTVVPYSNDEYYRARKTLALPKNSLLRIDDDMALHGKAEGLKNLYDNGQLAIINGVGYPNPNRSHFRSMEIWQTAVDSNLYSATGWVGRYFDNCCGGTPSPLSGVNVGNEIPQAFTSKSGVGVGFQDPAQFKWMEGTKGDSRRSFEKVNSLAGDHHGETTIDFLRHTTANAVISSDDVIRAANTKRQIVNYPSSKLSNQLKTVATLIAGGLSTRIYYTSFSGFDTHANQLTAQDRLMGELGGALNAFMADLKAIGVQDRVMTMVFSEFGRRVTENASRGTDHGTAGPMFLCGAGIKPGFHSAYPSLTDLDEGDLKYSVDFRSVYGELLDKWMKTDSKLVLGQNFKSAGILA